MLNFIFSVVCLVACKKKKPKNVTQKKKKQLHSSASTSTQTPSQHVTVTKTTREVLTDLQSNSVFVIFLLFDRLIDLKRNLHLFFFFFWIFVDWLNETNHKHTIKWLSFSTRRRAQLCLISRFSRWGRWPAPSDLALRAAISTLLPSRWQRDAPLCRSF